jgi:hypothetical protein
LYLLLSRLEIGEVTVVGQVVLIVLRVRSVVRRSAVRVSVLILAALTDAISLEFALVVELLLIGERLRLEIVVVFELVFVSLVLSPGVGAVLSWPSNGGAIGLVSVV